MRPYYRDGSVQHLAEQVFSTGIDGAPDLTLGRHQGRIEKLHQNLGHMGRTNYHWAMDAVIDHYLESGSCSPALVVFQTDGGPTSRAAAERYLCKAARLPLFWQFVGFGDPDDNEFAFLRRLDTLAVPATRVVDNAGFFHAGHDPQRPTAVRLAAERVPHVADRRPRCRSNPLTLLGSSPPDHGLTAVTEEPKALASRMGVAPGSC